MVLNSFHFGLAFSKDIAFDGEQASKALGILNKISEDGNSFFFSIFDNCGITRQIGPRLGRFAGNRIQTVPFNNIYTEERHLNTLANHTLLPVLYFSNSLPRQTRKNLFIFNFNEYDQEVRPFIEKRVPLQVDQNMLPSAFEKCTYISPAKLKVSDPYLNFPFIIELIKTDFFNRGSLEYHFLRAGVEEAKKSLDNYPAMNKQKYKEMISSTAPDWIHWGLDYFGKPSEKEQIQKKMQELINKNKISFYLYLLKDQHNSCPKFYWEDSAAHWHHRHISIQANMNKTFFESSHSFIYKKEREHYFRPLEKLHFRLSAEGDCSRFANAFDEPVLIRI